MNTARLQAACEYAWRLSNHQNKRDWQRCEQRNLALMTLCKTVAMPEPVAELPYCTVTAYREFSGTRLIITAPTIDNDFFWVAGRIDLKGNFHHNYTSSL